MMTNPELRRYFWQHFTPASTLIPLVAAVLLVFIFDGRPAFQLEMLIDTVLPLAGFFYIIIPASRAVGGEVSRGTWDFQRMSSVAPRRIFWGKLLGAPLYGWYIAALIWASYEVIGLRSGAWYNHLMPILVVVSLFCASVLSTGMGMLGRVPAGGRTMGREHGSFLAAFLAALAGLGLYSALNWLFFMPIDEARAMQLTLTSFAWFGFHIHFVAFSAITIAIYTIWAMLGGVDTLRHALRYPRSNVLWLFFLIFNYFYLLGIVPSRNDMSFPILFAPMTLVYAVLILLSLGLEKPDAQMYGRVAFLARQKNWIRMFNALPRWLVVVPIQLVVLATLVYMLVINHASIGYVLALLGVNCYLYRDILLYHAIVVPSASSRTFWAFFAGLCVYYLLLPYAVSTVLLPVHLEPHMAWAALYLAVGQLLASAVWLFSRIRQTKRNSAKSSLTTA